MTDDASPIPGADGPDLTAENVLDVDDDRYGSDSVALVTGAASGIGRATAVALAANGCSVAATDVDADGLAGTAERAAELGVYGTVNTVEGDLTDDADI